MTLLTRPPTLAEIAPELLELIDMADMPRAQRERLRAAVREAQRPTVRWASPRPGQHRVDGKHLACDLAALNAAWCAVQWPGQRVVRAADFAEPGAAHPAVSVRAGLKRAAAVLDPISRPLAAAVRSIRVVAGFIVYSPSGRVDIAIG